MHSEFPKVCARIQHAIHSLKECFELWCMWSWPRRALLVFFVQTTTCKGLSRVLRAGWPPPQCRGIGGWIRHWSQSTLISSGIRCKVVAGHKTVSGLSRATFRLSSSQKIIQKRACAQEGIVLFSCLRKRAHCRANKCSFNVAANDLFLVRSGTSAVLRHRR